MNDQSNSVSTDEETCWTLIHAAANGSASALNKFAIRYEIVIRRSLRYRWSDAVRQLMIDDAVQEILVECVRPGGVIAKADSEYQGGFRAFLYGVTRNVMLRFESRPDWYSMSGQDPVIDESSLGKIFDREFARAVMKEASQLQLRIAEQNGPAALRRVELLRARFQDNLSIREIAKRWTVEPAWLHHEYARARDEFRQALQNVIRSQQPSATDAENQETCRLLLGML